MWGNPLAWSTARIWALQTGGADEPGVLWCGTMPGGLFRSPDYGESWTLIRSLWDHPKRKQWMGGGADGAGIHSIIVDPRDSRRVWVAVSTGGIWFTDDTGATWAQRGEGMRADHVPPELTHDPIAQDVHCLVQCAEVPERMWVQHHNGIFVSSDEGRNFTEITGVRPSVFGFPVVVHPRDPNTAWFVPGIKDEMHLCRRASGGDANLGWRRNFLDSDPGLAAVACVGRGLRACVRDRRQGRTTRFRVDDGRPVGQ